MGEDPWAYVAIAMGLLWGCVMVAIVQGEEDRHSRFLAEMDEAEAGDDGIDKAMDDRIERLRELLTQMQEDNKALAESADRVENIAKND